MASAAFSNRLYRLDCSRLWSDEGLQTFLGSLRGISSLGVRIPCNCRICFLGDGCDK